MIGIRTNIKQVAGNILAKLNSLKDSDKLLRTIATDLQGEVHKRVHTDGIASNGAPIGTYSEAYMKVRTGNYSNSSKASKGKNKGALKDSGLFTRGAKKGEARPRYNRTADTKVIISLTRQMENDFSVIATEKGQGLGYKNIENARKVGYVEETYKKKIFRLTSAEKEQTKKLAVSFVQKIINGKVG